MFIGERCVINTDSLLSKDGSRGSRQSQRSSHDSWTGTLSPLTSTTSLVQPPAPSSLSLKASSTPTSKQQGEEDDYESGVRGSEVNIEMRNSSTHHEYDHTTTPITPSSDGEPSSSTDPASGRSARSATTTPQGMDQVHHHTHSLSQASTHLLIQSFINSPLTLNLNSHIRGFLILARFDPRDQRPVAPTDIHTVFNEPQQQLAAEHGWV